MLTVFTPSANIPTSAETPDAWWHNDWPYRVQVIATQTGAVSVEMSFSQIFSELGLHDAILDPNSLRVVPYTNGLPGLPIPFQETHTILFEDAEELNQDINSSDPYWTNDVNWSLAFDNTHHTQGSGSIHAQINITDQSSIDPWIKYHLNDEAWINWSDYELLLYDVRAQVNSSAVDQTPDIYHFELGGLKTCPITKINGPAMVMDTWNTAMISLKPFGNCLTPDLSAINFLKFYIMVKHTTENYGYYETLDELDLWLDNFRLLNQDSPGEIRWESNASHDSYYIYFDTINHTGHIPPITTTINGSTSLLSPGDPEAGGYFFNITNATTGNLSIWAAPTAEKILTTAKPPVSNQYLSISGARGELEPFQLIVRAPISQSMSISASPLLHSNGTSTISETNIEFFRVDYLNITQLSDFYGRPVLWPDPLYPVSPGIPINFPAEVNQPLWIRVRIPTTAQPGPYSGHISIGSAVIPFNLNVWDFFLPDRQFLQNHFGFDWDLVMETYGGTNNGIPNECAEKLESAITATHSDYKMNDYNEAALPDDVDSYCLTAYEVNKAHDNQLLHGKRVWWIYAPIDHPPHINPAVMDRPGIEGRMLPWLAWLDRVDGLYYPQSVDWEPDPYINPFSNKLNNGNGFFFYPPNDANLGFDPCFEESNRMVPSIRLELLREGLEDYAYFWLLNGGKPVIGHENSADLLVRSVVSSRTLISRIPTTFDPIRQSIAIQLEERRQYQFIPLLIH
ncbi:MAG: hypothetical protein ACOCYU_08075 [Brevefilum sp.]